MQIVAATGQHFFAGQSYNARTLEEITEFFIKEIEQGIDDTDIKAGVIKAAAGCDVINHRRNVLKAAARASNATGISLETPTNSRCRSGKKQAEIFEAEGVSPSRVSLGHGDDTGDMNYLIGLAKRGYMLGMDHTIWGMAPGATLPRQKRPTASNNSWMQASSTTRGASLEVGDESFRPDDHDVLLITAQAGVFRSNIVVRMLGTERVIMPRSPPRKER